MNFPVFNPTSESDHVEDDVRYAGRKRKVGQEISVESDGKGELGRFVLNVEGEELSEVDGHAEILLGQDHTALAMQLGVAGFDMEARAVSNGNCQIGRPGFDGAR